MNDDGAGGEPVPPRTLSRPVDPPAPLQHLHDAEAFRLLRDVRDRHLSKGGAGRPTGARLRTWASHVTGRSERRLLQALDEAMEVIVARCDLLADRVTSLETLSAEVASALSEEITHLRSEVEHLHTFTVRGGVAPHE